MRLSIPLMAPIVPLIGLRCPLLFLFLLACSVRGFSCILLYSVMFDLLGARKRESRVLVAIVTEGYPVGYHLPQFFLKATRYGGCHRPDHQTTSCFIELLSCFSLPFFRTFSALVSFCNTILFYLVSFSPPGHVFPTVPFTCCFHCPPAWHTLHSSCVSTRCSAVRNASVLHHCFCVRSAAFPVDNGSPVYCRTL